MELEIQLALTLSAKREWPTALARWESLKKRFPNHSDVRSGIAQILDKALADQAAANTVAFSVPSALLAADVDDSEYIRSLSVLFKRFESLGDTCEFGMVQRIFQADQVSLLRWAATSPENLVKALDTRFDGVGDPQHTVISINGDEYTTEDRRYSMHSHTFTSPAAEPIEFFVPEQCRRIQWLRGRLLDNLASASRIFVYKHEEGLTVNNVNSDLRTLSPDMILEFARIADQLRPWGVRMSLSVDLSSPQVVGNLSTFDPVDPTVIAWWQSKVDEIYKAIPDFAGFVIKADSEGRVGPSQYHRTPAEAANAVARALKPHGGIVLYRGFVYNNHLDYNDLKADRARAGYDNFHALDGKFEPNVVIQIKHGPIDFQVREPASPLFAALQHTSQAIELQITQEYLGQQRHMVFLVPMWKTTLDTDLRAQNRSTPVKEIVEGKSFHQQLGGFVGVANVGLDANWLHHPMAMANLYGFGKLAWNPNLTTQQIIDTWTRLTWGNNPKVVATIDDLQSNSWHTYEQYTGNLGIGTLTNILGYHYGPGIESAERNGWGQWFRADATGIGMDRTVATGTGYIGQYPSQLAKVYEDVNTCPDDLLLFMHHVPYTHVLHDGKTVVQHVYDAHYEGAATAQTYVPRWQTLHGLIDDDRYNETLKLFTYQAGHAIVWRDAVTRWFQKESSIPDKQGRVGNYPNRIEAENMTAEGYTPIDVKPWETASNSKAAVCSRPTGCTLTTTLDKPAGTYNITVQYFDFWSGKSHFTLDLNGTPIGTWIADDTLPPARAENQPNGDTSTRITFPNIPLKHGDALTLHGIPNNTEPAPVDYIEITKQ